MVRIRQNSRKWKFQVTSKVNYCIVVKRGQLNHVLKANFRGGKLATALIVALTVDFKVPNPYQGEIYFACSVLLVRGSWTIPYRQIVRKSSTFVTHINLMQRNKFCQYYTQQLTFKIRNLIQLKYLLTYGSYRPTNINGNFRRQIVRKCTTFIRDTLTN